MIGVLVVVVLVLAIFALIGAIWGKETAKGCLGLAMSIAYHLAIAAVWGVVIGLVLLAILSAMGVLR